MGEDLAMVDWWSETEHDIVACLRRDGTLSPAELGQRVGVSETEATMFLCMLVREGKIRIRLVESVDETQSRPSPCPLPRGERDSRELAVPVGAGSEWTSWDA
jgi:hypothetical protein